VRQEIKAEIARNRKIPAIEAATFDGEKKTSRHCVFDARGVARRKLSCGVRRAVIYDMASP
jgi:hypothetical protein